MTNREGGAGHFVLACAFKEADYESVLSQVPSRSGRRCRSHVHARAGAGPAGSADARRRAAAAGQAFFDHQEDPALDQIIAPDATLVELARGFGLTEGGLWMPDGTGGSWIFAGLLANVLYKVTPQKRCPSSWRRPAIPATIRTTSARRRDPAATMSSSSGRPAREWTTQAA